MYVDSSITHALISMDPRLLRRLLPWNFMAVFFPLSIALVILRLGAVERAVCAIVLLLSFIAGVVGAIAVCHQAYGAP